MNQDAPSPLVTVVIPAHNAAATIGRAVRSVLAQDWRPLDVIVVDDGSDDATGAVAAALGDARVRVLRLPARGGAAAARNAGIAAAHGEVIAFQDADDEWLPGKLTRQMAVLLADRRVLLVACGTRFIAPDGTDIGPLYDGQIPRTGAGAWTELLARNTVATPTVLAWRRDLLARGGFDASLAVGEDQDLWIRLAMRGHLGYVDAPLIRVHVVVGSLSGVWTRRAYREQLRHTLPMVQRHLALHRAELTRRQVRQILGERIGRIGRSAYSYGALLHGAALVARASLLGFEPLANLLFLASAAPPSRWLKRRLLSVRKRSFEDQWFASHARERGHPRLRAATSCRPEDVDDRDKPGHDELP